MPPKAKKSELEQKRSTRKRSMVKYVESSEDGADDGSSGSKSEPEIDKPKRTTYNKKTRISMKRKNSLRPDAKTFRKEDCLDSSASKPIVAKFVLVLPHNNNENEGVSANWKDNTSKVLDQIRSFKLVTQCKITNDRCYSFMLHPSSSKLLAIAGDKYGQIGILDLTTVGDGDNPSVIPGEKLWAHTGPIGRLAIHQNFPEILWSSCYDIGLQRFDMESGIFEEVVNDKTEYRYFDFIDQHTVAAVTYTGSVVVVDLRTNKKTVETDNLSHGHLKTVDCRRTQPHYFITAGSKGRVGLWDIRKLGKSPKEIAVMEHKLSVLSAFFSPISGSAVVTACMDHHLRVWNEETKGKKYTPSAEIFHNNKTGRWLTPFAPIWHPVREDLFISGALDPPRMVEIFDDAGNMHYRLPGVTTVCSLNVFHQELAAVAGVSSSGFVHLWR